MKKISLLVFVILLFTVTAAGCMIYKDLNIKQAIEFKKEIKVAYKDLKKMRIKYSVSSLYFTYSFEEADEDVMLEVFYKTKQLVINEEFQKDFFQKFFSTYFKDEKERADAHYPSIYIDFDLNNDGTYDYQFETRYFTYNSEGKKEFNGYKYWSYWDFKRPSKQVPEKNEEE